MRTIDAIHILKGVSDLAGLDADNLSLDDFEIIRRSLSKRLATAYEYDFWPELIFIEKRYFRDLWTAGATYSVPTATTVSEVYFPQTRRYYQALRAMPLTVSSITRAGSTATVTTAANHLLITGDQMSISGAVETDYNIQATITVTGAATFTYTVANAPSTPATGTIKCSPCPAQADNDTIQAYWAESLTSYSGENWSATETNQKGDIRYWPPADRFYVYYNASTSSGNQPGNATYWAILTDFDRYVAWAQTGKTNLTGSTPLGVYDLSPRLTTRGVNISASLSSLGIQVHEPIGTVYVEYRQKPPQLKGDAFDTAAVYTANVSQIYYNGAAQAAPTATPGNFYDCIVTTTAGQDPDDTAASWSIVSIPYDFERYLVQGGYADWLRAAGQDDKAAEEGRKADDLLTDQSMRYSAQSFQRKKTLVATR